MTDKKIDVTSAAVRSNPNAVDQAREDKSREAETVSHQAEKASRFRDDVDTTKTPEQERNANHSGQGIPGATTK